MLRDRLPTLMIVAVMIAGFIGIVATACNDPYPEFPPEKQVQIDYYRHRDDITGIRDMSPEARAASKLHLHERPDTWEIYY